MKRGGSKLEMAKPGALLCPQKGGGGGCSFAVGVQAQRVRGGGVDPGSQIEESAYNCTLYEVLESSKKGPPSGPSPGSAP